jgi:hypothetical protein
MLKNLTTPGDAPPLFPAHGFPLNFKNFLIPHLFCSFIGGFIIPVPSGVVHTVPAARRLYFYDSFPGKSLDSSGTAHYIVQY